MTAKVIAIVNRKGGVGKTTLTLALADVLCFESERPIGEQTILAADFDPQASLSQALLYDKNPAEHRRRYTHVIEGGMTLKKALEDRSDRRKKTPALSLKAGVGPHGSPYHLLAADPSLWDHERAELRGRSGEEGLIARTQSVIDAARQEFSEWVLIDCPPGQTVLAEAAIRSADLILCPTTPDHLSSWGLQNFQEYIQNLFKEEGRDPPPAFWVLNGFRASRDAGLQREITAQLEKQQGEGLPVQLLGESSEGPENAPILIPKNASIQKRLKGAPNLNKVWPWDRVYDERVRNALNRIANAIRSELGVGANG